MKYFINEMKHTKFQTLDQFKKLQLKKNDILKIKMKIDGIYIIDDINKDINTDINIDADNKPKKLFKYDIKMDINK